MEVGTIVMWAGFGIPPPGWLFCDGSAVDNREYPDLYDAIGTQYGPLEDGNFFRLPDCRGRFVTMSGGPLGYPARGATGGSKTATLALANLPSHNHNVAGRTRTAVATGNAPGFELGDPTQGATTETTQYSGAGAPFNVDNPAIALEFIILAEGTTTVAKMILADDFKLKALNLKRALLNTLQYKLFTAVAGGTITHATIAADFTPVVDTGYAAQPGVPTFAVASLNPSYQGELTAAPLTWTFTFSGGVAFTILGYYVIDPADGKLCYSQYAPAPVTVTGAGQTYTVTPRMLDDSMT